jgi:hypothetical protein
MPIGRRDIKIDDIASRNTAPDKREMIVSTHSIGFIQKNLLIPAPRSPRLDPLARESNQWKPPEAPRAPP